MMRTHPSTDGAPIGARPWNAASQLRRLGRAIAKTQRVQGTKCWVCASIYPTYGLRVRELAKARCAAGLQTEGGGA
jgi:hypothetical protein